MITTKQMLKGYRDGSFGGGTGPSIQCLDKRKRARNDSILTKILQGNSSYENAKNECSPPRKKKKKKRKGPERFLIIVSLGPYHFCFSLNFLKF